MYMIKNLYDNKMSCFQSAEIVIALHRPGIYGVEKFEGVNTGIDKTNPDKQDDLLIECILKQRDGWTGNLLLKHNLAHNKIWDYDFNQNNLIGYEDAIKKGGNSVQSLDKNW